MENFENFKNILENESDINQLKDVIKKINNEQNKIYLPLLIDFLFKNNNENAILDLKVLAIKAISKFKDKSALPALLYCLNDKNSNYKIRLASAEALGKIGDTVAFEPLKNIVEDTQEKSTYIKESAVTALGMLGDKRAINVFDSTINTKETFHSKFAFLKERIIEAMSKLEISKDNQAYEILKKSILDNSPQVRISTIETLMNSDMKNSYELIYDRLISDDDTEVKKNALIALYNMSDRRILDEVIKGDFDWNLKKYAKEIIDEYE